MCVCVCVCVCGQFGIPSNFSLRARTSQVRLAIHPITISRGSTQEHHHLPSSCLFPHLSFSPHHSLSHLSLTTTPSFTSLSSSLTSLSLSLLLPPSPLSFTSISLTSLSLSLSPPLPPSPLPSLTSIADNSDGRRREQDDSLLQQSQPPQNEYLRTKELQKLRETAGRVCDLERERERERER